MPLNTLGVVSAVTPSVIETYFSHYLNRGPLRQKPTAHISYHEGLRLIRQFLDYSSKHSVEDLQAFTAQWVPAPVWCRIQDELIPARLLERSADLVRAQLGPRGIELVGGRSWWVWRRPEQPMKAEWIEMKKDYNEWKRSGEKCDRALLYVHGGAYYFGSVDEHRYQIQRHARKLKARVLAPRYRLSPQFPFPCGLYDCIAAYLFLLEHFAPSQILIAGDSAGGGMVLSMLVTLRDQGVPLPAGTMLLSPWVDLTHSFPSTAGDGAGDYIPPHGFHHKPSVVWPPPNSDELKALAAEPVKSVKSKRSRDNLAEAARSESKVPSADRDLTIELDGGTVQIKDQIQMYSTNHMLAHPLVSAVQQPSLGGLPPMLIQVGGAELLRDEQIYLAHKAANPKAYPPGENVMNEYGLNRDDILRYPPTDVQLQVWDDLCHVPHTLSFTRPAKYMYRSVAQFGAWALSHAQHKPIVIMDDDQISIISDGPETDTEAGASTTSLASPKSANGAFPKTKPEGSPTGAVGKAGDPLPRFKEHMIRQRIDRHGVTYPLALPAELTCLHLDPQSIGAIKPGPVRKWLARKKETDTKYAGDIKKVQKKRLKEMQQGYDVIGEGERPPPTALAGRKRADMPAEKVNKRSWGLAMWSGWGSSHDESTIERTDKLERQNSVRAESPAGSVQEIAPGSASVAQARPSNGSTAESAQKRRRTSATSMLSAPWSQRERPVSPYRKVTDAGQADKSRDAIGSSLRPPSRSVSHRSTLSASRESVSDSRPTSRAGNGTAAESPGHQLSPSADSATLPVLTATITSPTTDDVLPNSTRVEGSENTFQSPGSDRPHNGTVAYPFKLRNPTPGFTGNASTTTLNSDDPESTRSVTPQPPTDYSDKEMVIPHLEKEVVVNQPSQGEPTTPSDGRGTPGNPFRLRSSPSNPLLSASSLRPASPAQSSSVPASPAGSSNSANPFSSRNPAFDPRMQTKFGPNSPLQENSPSPLDAHRNYFASQSATSPGPPKPVGFTYSPRDLRNAMLNRQAAESAAALQQQQQQHPQHHVQSHQQGPTATTRMGDYAGPSFAAVELPAISLPQSRPSGEMISRPGSAASGHPDSGSRTPASENNRPATSPLAFNLGSGIVTPVELSGLSSTPRPPTAPSTPTSLSAPTSPPPTTALPAIPTAAIPSISKSVSKPTSNPPTSSPNTTFLRENIVLPTIEPRRPFSPEYRNAFAQAHNQPPTSPSTSTPPTTTAQPQPAPLHPPPPPPPPKDDPATAQLIRKMSSHSLRAGRKAVGAGRELVESAQGKSAAGKGDWKDLVTDPKSASSANGISAAPPTIGDIEGLDGRPF